MRLLVAEDDKALGLFLRRGLEADGYRVRLESDGAAAVEAFREEPPDLTILDLNMPVKDGEQVLSDVRTMDADLPVLILTGRQEVDTRVRCLDRGADDLMVKPFSLSELRARVRALLRRKRATGLYLRAGDLEVSRLDHSVTAMLWKKSGTYRRRDGHSNRDLESCGSRSGARRHRDGQFDREHGQQLEQQFSYDFGE